MTRVCVSELSWNKSGTDYVGVGTTNGFVYVYDVQNNNAKTIFSVKGHDGKDVYKLGNIKNVVWVPKSDSELISSSYENEINLWDIKSNSKGKSCMKKEYPESIKIRDIKFNPHDSNYFAIQCSSSIKIIDIRNMEKEVTCKHIKDNELQGYMMQWDPLNKSRLASGVSK